MMRWSMIATWKMALGGVSQGSELLKDGRSASDAVVAAVREVEDNPDYISVGYGGLPNEAGQVEMDAAFMCGKTLSMGAVAGIRDYASPVSIARKLSENRYNIFLVGTGAEKYAHLNGFERRNMLTEKARKSWKTRVKEIHEKNLSPYDGHDTVCIIARDMNRNMAVGTSTSGLFMKKEGRVGDSPIPGSGFYADDEAGAAAATGLGEDIMKGYLSYEVVQRMRGGLSPMMAAQEAVDDFTRKLIRLRGKAGAISVIAMNNDGEWGIGTNCEFSFVASTDDGKPLVYMALPGEAGVSIEEVPEERT